MPHLPTRRLGALLLLVPTLAACGAAPMASAEAAPAPVVQAQYPAGDMPGDMAAPSPAPAQPRSGGPIDAPRPAGAAPAASPAALGAKSAAAERAKAPQALVIYTGELGVLVADGSVASSLDAAVLVAEELGGHLAGRGNDFVRVKVPSAQFREAMTRIEKTGEVTNRSVSAEDVTAEFKDLEVRLENLKATRKRIEELMGRAGNLTELFVVEKELERVTTEIDVIQGRLRFLRDSTSFSVITVRAAAKPKPVVAKDAPPPPPPPARPAPTTIDLPVSWLTGLGVDQLLKLD